MKKFLALFLVMATLLSTLAIFTSCGDSVNAKEAAEEPYTTLMKAMGNTINNFFVIDKDARKTLEKASEKGAFSINASNFEDTDLEKITSTVYMDKEAKSFAFDSTVKIDGKDYINRVYMNSDTLAATSKMEDINRSLKIDLDTIIAKLKTSALMEFTGMNDNSDAQQYIDVLIDAFKEVQKSMKKSYVDSVKETNEYVAIFMDDVTDAKIEIDGKKVDCVQIPLNFNSSNIEKFLKKALANIKSTEEFDKNEIIDEVKRTLSGAGIKFDIFVKKSDTTLAKIDVKVNTGELLGSSDTKPVIKGEIFFSDKQIVLKGSAKIDNASYSINAAIVKTTEKNVTTFDLSAKVTYKAGSIDGSMKLLDGAITYDKKSGDVEFDIKIPEADTSYKLKANFTAKDNKVTLSASSLTYKYTYTDYIWDETTGLSTEEKKTVNETYKFKVELSITSDATVPSIPSGATDIMDLSEEEWNKLANEFGIGAHSGDPIYPYEEETAHVAQWGDIYPAIDEDALYGDASVISPNAN